MNWFDWLRIALIVPTTIALIGLLAVLVDDIKTNR
jgi:hypothetical protein